MSNVEQDNLTHRVRTVSDTPLKLQKPRPDCLCYDNENIACWRGERDLCGINSCKWDLGNKGGSLKKARIYVRSVTPHSSSKNRGQITYVMIKKI